MKDEKKAEMLGKKTSLKFTVQTILVETTIAENKVQKDTSDLLNLSLIMLNHLSEMSKDILL